MPAHPNWSRSLRTLPRRRLTLEHLEERLAPANLTISSIQLVDGNNNTIAAPVITLGSPNVCPNGSDTASVPASYAHYYWYVDHGNITSGQGTNSITFSPSNRLASVEVSTGCKLTTSATSPAGSL